MTVNLKNSIQTVFITGFVACILLLTSCDKTPKQTDIGIDPADSLQNGVFICNEGNFQWGNASLSFYNTSSHKLYEDVFKAINNKPLGDVLQSITVFNNIAYLIVNNSGKIEMIDPKTFRSVGTITGLKSPRFLLGIQTNKAYVSDLYDNRISVIDIEQKKVINTIPCPGWTEEMLLYGNKVFISNKNSSYLYIVNSQSDLITDSIPIGYGSQCLQIDALNRLWVLTTGDQANSIPPQLHLINPSNLSILHSFSFAITAKPIKMIMNPAKTKIYWISDQAYSMDITSNSLPANPMFQLSNKTLYAIGYNKYENEILLANAKDYVQRSEILRYDTSGKYLGSFLAGINTSYFYSK